MLSVGRFAKPSRRTSPTVARLSQIVLRISAAVADEQRCNALARQQRGELPLKRLLRSRAFVSLRLERRSVAPAPRDWGQSVERYVGHLKPSGPNLSPRCRILEMRDSSAGLLDPSADKNCSAGTAPR